MASKTKKLCILAAIPLVAASFAGCGDAPEKNAAPEIIGAHDFDCMQFESVDLLYRVAALDREDGDITPKMDIDVYPYVNLKDGMAVFEEEGTYEVTYYVEDSSGEMAESVIYVSVYSRDVYRRFFEANEFYVTTSGNAEIVSEGVTDGVYGVNVTGAAGYGDAALSRIFELTPEESYTFEYTVRSSAMGTVRIAADGKEIAQKNVDENQLQTFSFVYTAPALELEEAEPEALDDEPDEELEEEDEDEPNEEDEDEDEEEEPVYEAQIDILFGGLGSDITFELERVKITPHNAAGEFVEQLNGFSFNGNYENRFDGTEGNAWVRDDTLVVEVTKAADANWKGGAFVNTHIPLNSGDIIQVSFDAVSTVGAPFEVVVQCKQWGPDEVIQTITPKTGERTEAEITVNDDRTGELWLYVQSGTNVNNIELSNLSVKKRDSGERTYSFDRFTESHDEGGGARQTLKVENGKVILNVQSFGSIDWQNKLESATFGVDGSVDKFIISFKAKATRRVSVVFAAPRAGGWDPCLVWSQFNIGTQEQYYFFTTDNVTAVGTHQLVWQFGSGANQSFNDVTIEISEIRINLRHGLFDYNDN